MEADAAFGDAGAEAGFKEGALATGTAHGRGGRGGLLVILTGGGKEQAGMTMSFPVLAEQEQSFLRQRQDTVPGPLAAMDMQHQSWAVDVTDFQMQGLLQA